MDSDEHARKLADSYAVYMKIDNKEQMVKLEESIEETLTRLEELDNGIKMLQAERERVGLCDLTSARSSLNTLCQQVHRLDELSKRVLQDVEALEPVVDEAEATLAHRGEGRLKTMLKPLFYKKSDQVTSPQASATSQFTPLPHFKTASFFPKHSEEETSPS